MLDRGGTSQRSFRWFSRAATSLLFSCSAILSSCALGPTIDCQVPLADCRHAVAIARPLVGSTWDQAADVVVHIGPCTRSMSCPPRLISNSQILTVELSATNDRDYPFVRIDRSTAAWEAECWVMVVSENEAHSERCTPTSFRVTITP